MPAARGTRVTRAVAAFDPIPSRHPSMDVAVSVASSVPDAAAVLGVPVYADGAVPDRQDFDRATLEASGFGAGVGETLVLPRVEGPTVIEVGLGRHAELDTAALRDAAAAFARAAARHGSLVLDTSGIGELEPAAIGQAVVEGVLLARYRYRAFHDQPSEAHLSDLTIVSKSGAARAMRSGAERGLLTARAVATARDLCNTPGTHLTARRYAEVAQALGAETGPRSRGLRRASARRRSAAAASSASTPAARSRPA